MYLVAVSFLKPATNGGLSLLVKIGLYFALLRTYLLRYL